MSKRLKFVLIGLLLLGLYFGFNLLIGRLTYTVGGQRGYSFSINESKERGVFIKKLKYEVIPDSLKLNHHYTFFIEKGFSYGKNSIFQTDSLTGKELKYPYQIVFRCEKPCEKYRSCDFDCKKKKFVRKDTFVQLPSPKKISFELYKLRQTKLSKFVTKLSQFVHFSLASREKEETKTKYSSPF